MVNTSVLFHREQDSGIIQAVGEGQFRKVHRMNIPKQRKWENLQAATSIKLRLWILLVISMVILPWTAFSQVADLDLTPAEQEWLKEHPIIRVHNEISAHPGAELRGMAPFSFEQF